LVFQAFEVRLPCIAQGVVGEVEDVIRLVVRQVELEQVQAAVDGFGEPEFAHEEVQGADAAVSNAAAALAELVVDVAGGEHGFGAAAQVALVETFLDPALATCQLLAYPGVHSKSSRDWGDEPWLNTHQTPETPQDFEFFHEIHAV
jgi:hypothetical protein